MLRLVWDLLERFSRNILQVLHGVKTVGILCIIFIAVITHLYHLSKRRGALLRLEPSVYIERLGHIVVTVIEGYVMCIEVQRSDIRENCSSIGCKGLLIFIRSIQ